MFFIAKSVATQTLYNAALNGHATYEALSGSVVDRDNVKLILLNEQGCLCVFCEKRLDIRSATIEHFLPQGIHSHLDVDYYNLYACCYLCNNKKGDHLIPAYISDKRLNALEGNRHRDFHFYYRVAGEDECVLQNDNIAMGRINPVNDQYCSDLIFTYTIQMLNLNDPEKLSIPRRAIFKSLALRLRALNNNELIAFYQSHLVPNQIPAPGMTGNYSQLAEHISLRLYCVSKEIRRRGLAI